MKLQKVLVVLGISTCLLAAEIQGTFGMEEEMQQEGEAQAEEDQESAEEEPEQPESEPGTQLEATEPEVQPESAESRTQPELTEPEVQPESPEPVTQPELTEPEVQPESPETGTEPGQQPGSSAPGEPETNTKPSESEQPEEAAPLPDGQKPSDTPDSDSGQQAGDTDHNTGIGSEFPEEEDADRNGTDESGASEGESSAGEGGPSVEDGLGQEDQFGEGDSSGEKEASSGNDALDGSSEGGSDQIRTEDGEIRELLAPSGDFTDEVTDRVGISDLFGVFKPSSEFIDNREKIKYNVEMPIEGLPEFITAEMVVGALKCQDQTGYPASVTIAQIIQESGFGKYGPEGDRGQGLSYLAYQYNNLFGIKGMGPAGTVDMGTGEQAPDGSMYRITAGFRVYHTYTECIEDRAKLLEEVYSDLTYGVKDANTFAMRIGRRWATSLTYGQNLIRQMEQYDLYRLDKMTVDEFSDMLGIFVNPCPGSVLTSGFGYRTAPMAGASTYHKGIDLGTGSYNIPTYAVQEGTVIYAGAGGAEGNFIVIAHENGLVTKYMHHDKIYVEAGDEVEKGQQIGLSGSTGNSTGNHLHFQVEKDGEAVDPLLYLDIQ